MKLSGEHPSTNSLILRRDGVIDILRKHYKEIQAFHVASLYLFGSVVRNEANASSDVDLLVEFTKPVGMFTFVRLQIYLEKLLGCAIDLGTPNSLKPDLRDVVMSEAERVF